jgi:hypothetical protein
MLTEQGTERVWVPASTCEARQGWRASFALVRFSGIRYGRPMSSFSSAPSSVFMDPGLLTNGASGLAPFR